MFRKPLFLVLGGVFVIVLLAQGFLLLVQNHPVSGTPNLCVLNLRAIDQFKSQWMDANHKTTNDIPSWDDLLPYAKSFGWTNAKPVCPQGGTYTIGRVGEPAKCSIGGPAHTLSE